MDEGKFKFASRPSASGKNQLNFFRPVFFRHGKKGYSRWSQRPYATYVADKALKVNYEWPCFCASVELKSFYSSL